MAICGYIEGKFLHFPLPVLPVCFAAGNRQRPLKPLPPVKALPVPCILYNGGGITIHLILNHLALHNGLTIEI